MPNNHIYAKASDRMVTQSFSHFKCPLFALCNIFLCMSCTYLKLTRKIEAYLNEHNLLIFALDKYMTPNYLE